MIHWPVKKLGEILDTSESSSKLIKVKKEKYSISGLYPVVDQGVNFITGYINEEKMLYKGSLPVVIFGDHTRTLKFINFKFAVGADGTKILKPKNNILPKYFFMPC
jgi:type I restriction enzyme S subunit